MSSTIRQSPTDSLASRRLKELEERETAARRVQIQENTVETSGAQINRGTNAGRVSQLLDRATTNTDVGTTDTGSKTSSIGAAGAAPLGRTQAVDELAGHQQVYGTGEARLNPPSAPRVQLNERTVNGAESFATNLGIALDSVVADIRRGTTNVGAGGVRALNDRITTEERASRLTENRAVNTSGRVELSGTSADELLSTFLKLNINDPNENVETHDKLYTLATNLRQQAIEDAKKKSENAQKQMKEAQAYAQQAEIIGTVVTVLSIVLTIVTFGAGAGVAVAATAATQAATVAAQQAAQQAAQAAVQNAVQAAVQKAVEQAAQQGTQEAVKQAVQQAVQSAAQEAVKSVPQAAIQNVIQAAAKEGVTLTVEQATTMVTDQIAQQIAQTVGQQVAEGLAQQGMSQALQQTAVQTGQNIANNIAAQTAQVTSKSFIDRATQVARHMVDNGISSTMQRTALIGTAALQGVSAGANYKAADKMLDAKEAQLGVTKARFRADQAQERVQDEAEIINTIMESKNQTIDAVMQMTNATWASRQQLMAASIAK